MCRDHHFVLNVWLRLDLGQGGRVTWHALVVRSGGRRHFLEEGVNGTTFGFMDDRCVTRTFARVSPICSNPCPCTSCGVPLALVFPTLCYGRLSKTMGSPVGIVQSLVNNLLLVCGVVAMFFGMKDLLGKIV